MATGVVIALIKLDISNNGLGPGGALAIEEILQVNGDARHGLASADAHASSGLRKAAQGVQNH